MGPDLLVLAAVLAGLGVHPFTSYPASLALLARLRPRPIAPGGDVAPRVALCVCAYNEAAIIRAKADNMLAMRAQLPGLRLLVYVDAASDDTARILREYADQIEVIVSPQRHGKTHGMNTLVAAADVDIVVFSDANVMFAPDAIPLLLRRFGDATVGCVCGHLIYTKTGAGAASATAATGSLYWRLEEAIKQLETASGSTMGADGSIFAIRRRLHRPPPPDIIDDMFVSLSILCDGWRVVRAADAIAYEATVSTPREEFRRKIRIACQAFNVHRLLWPRLRRLPMLDLYKYVSHKLLRWLAVFLLAGAGIALLTGLAAMHRFTACRLLLAAACALVVAGRLLPNGIAGKLLDIAGAFTATGLGVLRSLRGERFQTWTPPSSARTGGQGG